MSINKYIGDRIFSLRVQNCLSQLELAKLAGISFKAVQQIESGRYNLSVVDFFKICLVLKIKPRMFLKEFEH